MPIPEIQKSKNVSIVSLVLALALLSLFFYLAALTRNAWKSNDYIGKTEEFPHTITILGKGKVFTVPDIANISLGLKTEKKTVAEAQLENTKKMNKLHEELKKIGIPKEDVATTNYSVYPVYDWNTGRQQLRAYSVDQSVKIKIKDFEKIPNMLALIGVLELNQVGDLQFTVDNMDKYEQEARLVAVKNAKTKAETLAKEAGVKLGKIVSFDENFGTPTPIYYKTMYAEAAGMGGGMPAPTIEAGTNEITVNVTITYEVL